MGIVIAVISGKGGVGKTTTTANVGLGMALKEKKIIVVDFDIGQRNLDMILGLENRVVFDIVQVMDEEVSLKQAVIKSKICPDLHFLAASQTILSPSPAVTNCTLPDGAKLIVNLQDLAVIVLRSLIILRLIL